jgi:NYN domain
MTDTFRLATATALLIDGDNLSPALAGTILRACGPVPAIRRVYADLTTRCGWAAVPGLRAVHAGQGKNAADLLLTIEAMELALNGTAGGFAIASSDGDFAHLAHRLRERGHPVTGIGEGKAPDRFRAACTRFVDLGPAPAPQAPPPSPAETLIIEVLQAQGTMALARLGSVAGKDGGLKAKGIPNLRRWLTDRPALFALAPKGTDTMVSLRRPANR